jgi:hypothetical protein
MKYLFFLYGIVFFAACSTTKKEIKESFNRSFFYDTGYFKIVLPLYSRDFSWDDTMNSLLRSNYVKLIRYKDLDSRPVYEVTEKGKEYLTQTFYNANRDSEHLAVFNYYRLNTVRLNTYRFLNKNKDSIEAVFRSDYKVIPLFAVNANPSYTKIIFTKSDKGWQMQDSALNISRIYRVDDEKWWKGLAFMQSDGYWQWFSKGRKK